MFGYPACWCIHVWRRTRHYLSGTRSHLNTQLRIFMFCINISQLPKINQNSLNNGRHKPAQAVGPLFVYPAGQLPHVRLPGVLVHARLASQPPLLDRHSFTSKHAVACNYVLRQQHSSTYSGINNLCYHTNPTQTCAARGPIVRPASRTGATCAATRRVGACTLAVTPAVV